MSSVWAGACAAAALTLVAAGYPAVADEADNAPPAASDEQATTDGWLAAMGLSEPSATIRAVLATVPVEQGIFFIGPADQPALTLLFFNISTLAFPNKVGLIQCDPAGGPAAVTISPPTHTLGAALVWTPDTAYAPGPGEPVGPFLHLVTGTGATEWTSFCSP
jgi:hypothetical protein